MSLCQETSRALNNNLELHAVIALNQVTSILSIDLSSSLSSQLFSSGKKIQTNKEKKKNENLFLRRVASLSIIDMTGRTCRKKKKSKHSCEGAFGGVPSTNYTCTCTALYLSSQVYVQQRSHRGLIENKFIDNRI